MASAPIPVLSPRPALEYEARAASFKALFGRKEWSESGPDRADFDGGAQIALARSRRYLMCALR